MVWRTRGGGGGDGASLSSVAAVDWSKVPPHLRGYYSKIYGADGGGGGVSSPSAADARREAGGQPTVHQQQQQHDQELPHQQHQQKANEMADDGSPISPEEVPTLDVAEFKRQQQALERNTGTVGGVGATTAAVSAAGRAGKEQPPAAAAAAAGQATEEKEKEATVVQARAAYNAPPPPPLPPPPLAMEIPSKEEIMMTFRQSEERAADVVQNQRLPNELEEEGRKRQELALENASIRGGVAGFDGKTGPRRGRHGEGGREQTVISRETYKGGGA